MKDVDVFTVVLRTFLIPLYNAWLNYSLVVECISKTLSCLFLLVFPLHHHRGNQSCLTADDIMTEVNASLPEQRQEVGAVLGRILYHALQGHCFIGQPLPEESFFLDYIMDRLGSENFTVGGKCPARINMDTATCKDRTAEIIIAQKGIH